MRKKSNGKKKKEKRNAYSTRYSQAVTHPSTNLARLSLTSVIGREPVFSQWYGRRQKIGAPIYSFVARILAIGGLYVW